jgi:toxin YoeB
MRDIRFTPLAFEQYNEWLAENKVLFTRLQKLIVETARTPFDGTGKP